jgi:conjugative relaxase-like TrwC/TraI family protein
MLRVNKIKGGRDAINYYAALVREQDDDPAMGAPSAREEPGAEDYYIASPEEGGRWWGQGRQALGLDGLGTREQLRALFAGRHPETGAQLGQRPNERTIRAYDLTFSAPKSVSLLASLCGGETERTVIDAHDRAVEAALSLLEERSTTRGGKGGQVRLEIGGITALLVRHRTSRALDPQLHTHALLMARVQGSDGRWRALDATTAMRGVLAFGSIYQSALRSELHRALPGIAFGPVRKGQAEVEGLDELKGAFSKRTQQAQRKYELLLKGWRERHPGREPTLREEARLRRRAAYLSRPAKDRARTLGALRADWLQTARGLGFDPARIEREARSRARGLDTPARGAQELAREAIEALCGERSVFAREHVEREVAARLGYGAGRDAMGQARAIEALAASAIEEHCMDLAALGSEGQRRALSLAREPALERYTTRALLEEEQAICRWMDAAAAQGGERASDATVARALAALGRGQGAVPAPDPEQIEAAALIAGQHKACVIVGPAGAGKTTTLRLAAAALRQEGREVLVLTPWARAAAAARAQTGLPAENVSRYLAARSRAGALRAELRLRPGGTLVIDEAGTLPTPDWRALIAAAEADRLRLVFMGDHRQLQAVGRGGMFDAARERLEAIELARVHRFRAPWEREASLLLRAGRPDALMFYEAHERIVEGGSDQVQERMLGDWQEAHRQGRSYAFCVPTRAQAAHLSERAQERRVAAGELCCERELRTVGSQSLYVGDLVATRKNERDHRIVRGGRVRNRELWTVKAIASDGSLTLARGRSERTVASAYAREHVELAYFQTVHGVQGRTVERGGVLVDGSSGFRSLYVGMTRGRDHNVAYVASGEGTTAREVLEGALVRDRADLGVLAQARSLAELARRRRRQVEPELAEPELPSRAAKPAEPRRAVRGPRVRDGRLVLGPERGLGREAPELGIGL